jgi:type III restriction enzyme
VAEKLRRVVSTVGKRGEPGEHVRCVVSVSMLTEGWDANNVTHILGVRAFGSQLLCEQVVGRGLRRMNYDPDPTSGLFTEEYVDVYGIPFSVIPFRGRPVDKPEPGDKPRNHVRSLPEREHFEIRFPIVEGFVFALRKNVIKCDVDALEPLDLNPGLEPELTYMHPTAGYHDQATAKAHPFEIVKQSRDAYYAGVHFQTIQFQAAQAVIERLLAGAQKGEDAKSRVLRLQSRHQLFPQVYAIVKAYTERRVRFHALVDFFTTRPLKPVTRSHVNAVVMDSGWEGQAADMLDACSAVECFARNDHMGLVSQYGYLDVDHDYTPDFVVRLTNSLQVVLEIKGYMFDADDRVNEKNQAATKWVAAVNNLGDFGTWDFLICHKVEQLPARLEALAKREILVSLKA